MYRWNDKETLGRLIGVGTWRPEEAGSRPAEDEEREQPATVKAGEEVTWVVACIQRAY